jgi:putative transposase
MLGFERTALRYVPQRPVRDAALCDKLRALAATYTRWGVPRLHWKLQRDGWRVNYKRVERLYRLEGLAVRRRKRKRLAVSRLPRPEAEVPNDSWGIDFVSDQLASGRRIRCCTVIDACTRENVMITDNHRLPSAAVIAALDAVIATRRQPVRLSLDSGSEFRSRAFDAWAADRGIDLAFIQPGKPIQNTHIESFNGRFRDECLNQHYSSPSRMPASTSSAGAAPTTKTAPTKPAPPSPRASTRVRLNPHPRSDSLPNTGERTGGPSIGLTAERDRG